MWHNHYLLLNADRNVGAKTTRTNSYAWHGYNVHNFPEVAMALTSILHENTQNPIGPH